MLRNKPSPNSTAKQVFMYLAIVASVGCFGLVNLVAPLAGQSRLIFMMASGFQGRVVVTKQDLGRWLSC